MNEDNILVQRESNQIVISGKLFESNASIQDGPWQAVLIDHGRLLLTSKASGTSPDQAEGFAKCSIDVFHDMLVGLCHRRWTGVFSVDTGFGLKKLYFNRGDLTFAGSSLIDDRLGEVIYREELISLDQLTNSACQVDRSTKFGQVLIRDQIFTNTDLWLALKSQVREIFRSIFLVPKVYVEITKGTPPTEVTFDEGTESLIESAHCSGLQFRAFSKRIRPDSQVFVIDGTRSQNLPHGTFFADLLQLVRQHPVITDLIEFSKLTQINTLLGLHRMACLGLLSFKNLEEARSEVVDTSMANLRSKLDAFSMLQAMVIKAFNTAQIPLPTSELQKFAWSLNEAALTTIFIDDAGTLGAECLGNIMSQCQGNVHRIPYFEIRLDSLIRYTLQLVGDLLPNDVSKSIRKNYAEISN